MIRARDLGISFGRLEPGPHNAITDVPGVRVGHVTVVEGAATRTGVTAVIPRDGVFLERAVAGGFVLNGAGEMTGLTQVLEWGLLETPILLTSTHETGAVSDHLVRALVTDNPKLKRAHEVVIPVVGECDDSWLNDSARAVITRAHVEEAMVSARSGPVVEGSVGGGTGMVCCDFKGGIGTSSRSVDGETLGVLVQVNFGLRRNLRIGGYPVGAHLDEVCADWPRRHRDFGSIIVVVATDAPLSAAQLSRVSRRAALGVGRAGSFAAHGSGEIVIAFSTAGGVSRAARPRVRSTNILDDEALDPLFEAAADATEEAIANALCAAEDMVGRGGHEIRALPLDEVRRWLAGRPG